MPNLVGVTRTKDGRFGAVLKHSGTSHYAGVWASAESAALARDRAILHFGLEQERGLNFPGRARKLGPATPEALKREARLAHLKARGALTSYFGVTRYHGQWTARLRLQGKSHHVGYFEEASDAARAYDRVALFYLGKKAMLNFPEDAVPAPLEEVRTQVRAVRKADCTSKYRGVYWDAARGLWLARLRHAEQTHALGRFASEEDAARAYDYAAWAALKDNAKLNFAAPPRTAPPPTRSRPTPQPKLSRYQGVSHSGGSFVASVRVDGEMHHLGRWPDEREAAIAYDRAVLYFRLEKPLNLPKTSERLGMMAPQSLQNQARLRQRKRHGKTSYIGVSKSHGRDLCYKATVIDAHGRGLFVGAFNSAELAAIAHDRVVLHLHGHHVVRNFPERELRPATAEEMREHAHRLFKERTTSQYRGVTATRNGKWSSAIMARRVKRHLGTFESEEEAAEAYDKAAKKLHKEQAKLNF